MLEIEGIGSEVVTVFFIAAVTVAVLSIFVSAWRLTGRRPLFYDLFLVEIHSWGARRFVQVLQLGQEFRPFGSWSDVMARMRSRARSQVPANDAPPQSTGSFDTNVVIQSPATVMDDSTASIPPPSSSTLWEIEMPLAASGAEGGDTSHESHFAAAAAIAVLGRGGFQGGLSRTMDVVPGTPSVSAVGVSSVGPEVGSGDLSAQGTQRHHAVTNFVMPMSISVVNDEPSTSHEDTNRSQASDISTGVDTQQHDIALDTQTTDVAEKEPRIESSEEGTSTEIEGDSVIRLKFLDDTQRDARTTMTDTIGKFKSIHFGDAVAAGRVVRLIYQGQLLREESRTLASYGLRDGCVVHCHISNTPYRQTGSTQPVSANTGMRHRTNVASVSATPAPDSRPELQGFRYPRWAVALLLYTYRFPIIGLSLDAAIRFLFDRHVEQPSGEPGILRRTYQRVHNAVFGPTTDDHTSALDRAADAAARPLPPRLCLGNYLLWIFAGQFCAVWGLVYAFPQLCDSTALGLLILLTLYFIVVVCRSRNRLVEPRPRENRVFEPTNSNR